MDDQEILRPPSDVLCESGLSYKFQRLRERLREAIASGELAGKLPGERTLAKKFRVNAKTLSKALTDLAGEGVLQRRIGQGTFVAGSATESQAVGGWLIMTDPQAPANLTTELLKINPESRCVGIDEPLRPSLLSQFSAVINCAGAMPDSFYHDLMIRGIAVIDAIRPAKGYSTHGILLDRALGVFNLGRDLLMAGHVRLAAVDQRNSTTVFDALNWAVARYGVGATVHACTPDHIIDVLQQGVTAIICDGVEASQRIRLMMEERQDSMPMADQIALAAVGELSDRVCCSGYYLDPARQAQMIANVLKGLQPHRLSVVWLTGIYADRGTIHASAAPIETMLPNRIPALLAS